MTKNELIKALRTLPGDPLIVMSKDGEGNGFSPLAAALPIFYIADTAWRGDIWGPEENETPPEKAIPAVCLWPSD